MLILDKDIMEQLEAAEVNEKQEIVIQTQNWPVARTPHSQPSPTIFEAAVLQATGAGKTSPQNSGRRNSRSQITYGGSRGISQSQSGTVFHKKFSAMEGLQKIELRVQIAGEIASIKDKLSHFIYS